MKPIKLHFVFILAFVFFLLEGKNLFATQENIKVFSEYELKEFPFSSVLLSIDYDSGNAAITVSTFQLSDLTVLIIDNDSCAVFSTNYFPAIPGYPNQSYIINAPLIPGEYIIYLTMGGSAWQGMFIVE